MKYYSKMVEMENGYSVPRSTLMADQEIAELIVEAKTENDVDDLIEYVLEEIEEDIDIDDEDAVDNAVEEWCRQHGQDIPKAIITWELWIVPNVRFQNGKEVLDQLVGTFLTEDEAEEYVQSLDIPDNKHYVIGERISY